MRLQEGKLDFEIWIFFCQHPLVGVRLLSGGDDKLDDHDVHDDGDDGDDGDDYRDDHDGGVHDKN